MPELTADDVFERFFWPHYPPDVRADPGAFRDLDANPANNPAVTAHLAQAAEILAQNAPRILGTAAPLRFDAEGIGQLARALDRTKRDALIAASDPSDPENPLLNTVIHASAFVGEVIVRAHGGRWSVRRPLWESVVSLRAPGPSGTHRERGAIPPFHWLLKQLADAEIDEASLSYRFRIHVELATVDLDALPAIESSPRLPPLKNPTYDLLVKYLHQHVPGLRDVGAGFPSAAEFTARNYASLAFERMHGGRVLALHGQVPARGDRPGVVEITWLTAQGFDHADAIPTDEHPPYFARPLGDVLEVTVAWKGKPLTHRISFRGHG